MDKELVSSFEAALKRFSTYEKSKPFPSGYAFVPIVNRALRGSREWYKSTWPKHAPGPFDVANVGSWFGDLKGRRIPWVQTKGKSSGFPLVVRGFDSDQAAAANKWAQRSMQWRYSFDDVRRQNEVKLAATSSTAIVPYDVGYAAKQSAKYGFVGPMPDESFYGPTRKGATGFEAHATKARLDKIKESFDFAMRDSDEQFILGAMHDKGWTRDQAEKVYFKNLTENTKWLRFIARDNPKIAKNLIPIAKAVGKASGLPFIGGLFANPMTAVAALGIGAVARTVGGADEANATVKKWKAYEGLYGNPTDKQKRMARLAGIKDVANISKIYGRLNVQRGDAESYLMNIGMAFRSMDERSAQLLAESEGLSPEEVRLAKLYAGESASKADVVDANIEYLKEIQQRGFETGSGAMATMRSLSLSIPYAKSAVARGMVEGDERFNEQLEKIKAKEWSKNRAWSVASNYRYDDPEKYQAMADAIKNTWDEVHDTAEIDDRYRAGMYDNSTTNNNGGDRSVTVIQHINAEVKDSDPVGFVKEMTLLGGRGKHEAESVLQNNDSLRTN